MKKPAVLIIIIVLVIAGVIVYQSGSDVTQNYVASLLKDRAEKDLFMKTSDESPFRNIDEPFTKLNYFPPDESFKVKAKLNPIENRRVVTLQTSDGLPAQYLEFAEAVFDLKGKTNKVVIFEVMDPGATKGTLFLAFADSTSARETYGAGRYLELKKIPAMTSVVLDFNKAYNPYCAYSDKFSCPLPPKENILSIAINAGEKSWH